MKPDPRDEGFPPRDAVAIQKLDIKDLRILEDLRLDFRVPENGRGQWVLLLGDNGVGKTTVLRALVLCLQVKMAHTLLQIAGPSSPFLRRGAVRGIVDVGVRRGRESSSRQVEIRPGMRNIESVEEPERSEREGVRRWEEGTFLARGASLPIFAYGCQRGTALGGPARTVEFKPLDEVRGLFDDSARLINAETWLKDLRLAALQETYGPAAGFFDAVCDTLKNVLNGVDNIEVGKDGVFLDGPSIDRARLAALSDGYITTAGWVIDLIARWSNRCQEAEIELNHDFREQMRGLVLIDEIDLHLHPRWQLEIVSTLREQFPHLSFIATTHNPLTLLGAEPGEIHVLHRDSESGRIVADQRDIPPGARADQVLTGEWFGLASTVDEETRAMLAEHRQLLRVGVERSDERRLELELRRRLGTFADTSTDRMVQSIVAEVMGDDFEELTPEERKNVRSKVLELARERA